MSEIGIDAYWDFYRDQSKLLINCGIEFKEIGAKKAYINKLWKKEKKQRKIIIDQTKKAIEANDKIDIMKDDMLRIFTAAIEDAKKLPR